MGSGGVWFKLLKYILKIRVISNRLALEQGIAQSMRSKDTHSLVKQGVKLIEDVERVLEKIRPMIRPAQSKRLSPPAFSVWPAAMPKAPKKVIIIFCLYPWYWD